MRNYLRVQRPTWPGCSKTAALIYFDDRVEVDMESALHYAIMTAEACGGKVVACYDAPGLEGVALATPCEPHRHDYPEGEVDCRRCGVALACSYIGLARRCRGWATSVHNGEPFCKLHAPRSTEHAPTIDDDL